MRAITAIGLKEAKVARGGLAPGNGGFVPIFCKTLVCLGLCCCIIVYVFCFVCVFSLFFAACTQLLLNLPGIGGFAHA